MELILERLKYPYYRRYNRDIYIYTTLIVSTSNFFKKLIHTRYAHHDRHTSIQGNT